MRFGSNLKNAWLWFAGGMLQPRRENHGMCITDFATVGDEERGVCRCVMVEMVAGDHLQSKCGEENDGCKIHDLYSTFKTSVGHCFALLRCILN